MIRCSYGEYKVIVDGETLVDGGAWVIVGVMPAAKKIIGAVRERLSG